MKGKGNTLKDVEKPLIRTKWALLLVFAAVFSWALAGCQRCVASSGCTGAGNQSGLDASVNNNPLVGTTSLDIEKRYACDSFTSNQTRYGVNCVIKWQ